jgi:rhamnose transport system permease protein
MTHISPLLRRQGWNLLLLVLIALALIWSSQVASAYLGLPQLFDSTKSFVVPGMLALGLLVVVLQGEIDISLTSTLAVGTVMLAKFSAAGWPLLPAFVVVLVVCALLGVVNGILVTVFGLPSLAVTLGTMGAYRGLAYLIGGDSGYSGFDTSYSSIGSQYVGIAPASLVLFLVLAVVVAFVLQRTVFGRQTYAVGSNAQASRVGGVPVIGVKIAAYALGGAMAAVAALIWVGQYGSARADNADGSILFVVTAVVLGGAEIAGGKGTVLGTVLSLLLLGTLTNGMGLINVGGPTQTLVQGVLLVTSIGIPRLVRLLAQRFRRPAPAPAARKAAPATT